MASGGNEEGSGGLFENSPEVLSLANPKAINVLLGLLPEMEPEERLSVIEAILSIAMHSNANCDALCEIGVVGYLLDNQEFLELLEPESELGSASRSILGRLGGRRVSVEETWRLLRLLLPDAKRGNRP